MFNNCLASRPMATGSRIRHYRQKLGWRLDTLSELSGVDVGTISALENRDSKRSEFFPAIANAFGLTIDQLQDQSTDWIDALGKGGVSAGAQGAPGTSVQRLPSQNAATETIPKGFADLSFNAQQLGRWFDELPDGNYKFAVFTELLQIITQRLGTLPPILKPEATGAAEIPGAESSGGTMPAQNPQLTDTGLRAR